MFSPLFNHCTPSIFTHFLPRRQKNIVCTCFLHRAAPQTSSLISTGDSSLSPFPCYSFQCLLFLKNHCTPTELIKKRGPSFFLIPIFLSFLCLSFIPTVDVFFCMKTSFKREEVFKVTQHTERSSKWQPLWSSNCVVA